MRLNKSRPHQTDYDRLRTSPAFHRRRTLIATAVTFGVILVALGLFYFASLSSPTPHISSTSTSAEVDPAASVQPHDIRVPSINPDGH